MESQHGQMRISLLTCILAILLIWTHVAEGAVRIKKNLVRNSGFNPFTAFHDRSRIKATGGIQSWGISRGGAYILNNTGYFGTPGARGDGFGYPGASSSSFSVQIPAVPGRSIYQVLSTREGMAYYGSVSIQTPLLDGEPAAILLSVVDQDGTQLFFDFLKEKMTRAWVRKEFDFVAISSHSILTFSAVAPNNSITPTIGVSLDNVMITEAGMASRESIRPQRITRQLIDTISLSMANQTSKVDMASLASAAARASRASRAARAAAAARVSRAAVGFRFSRPLTTTRGLASLASSLVKRPPPPRRSPPPLRRRPPPPRRNPPPLRKRPPPPRRNPPPMRKRPPPPRRSPPPPRKRPPPFRRNPPPPRKRPPPPKRAPPPRKQPPPPRRSPPPLRKRPPPPRRNPPPLRKRPPPPRRSSPSPKKLSPPIGKSSVPPTRRPPPPRKSPPPLRKSPPPPMRHPPPPRRSPPPPRKNPPPPRKSPPPPRRSPPPPRRHPPPPRRSPPPPRKSPPPPRKSPPPPRKSPPPPRRSPPPPRRSPPPPRKSPPPPIKQSPPPRSPPPPSGKAGLTFPPFPPAPPTSPTVFFGGTPLSTIVIDYNANNAIISGSTVALTYNANGGSRWQSQSYGSGFFQTSLKCPQGSTTGLLTSVYLNSNAAGTQAQGMGFDFPGNDVTKAYVTYTVTGVTETMDVSLGYDCSATQHLYSIYWDSNYIAWYIDQVLVHARINTLSSEFVTLPLYLFGSIVDASAVDGGTYAGKYTGGAGASFTANFFDISVLSPVGSDSATSPPASEIPQNPPPLGGQTLAPVIPNYCNDMCLGCSADNVRGDVTIRYNKQCGSRFQSTVRYPSFVMSADIKCPDNDTSGLIISYYSSTQEGGGAQDEIDWEFIGNNKRIIQSNFYVYGTGGNEIWHPLGFDCGEAFHNYAIEWTEYNIIWYVDYKPVRIVVNTQEYTGIPYPLRPMYVYGSVWDASFVCNGCWTGKRANHTLADDFNFYAEYRNMKVLSPI